MFVSLTGVGVVDKVFAASHLSPNFLLRDNVKTVYVRTESENEIHVLHKICTNLHLLQLLHEFASITFGVLLSLFFTSCTFYLFVLLFTASYFSPTFLGF